jgi:hypothetical protein
MSVIADPGVVPALVLPLSSPDGGRLVVIETTAPVAERGGPGFGRLIEEVLKVSGRRARALGLGWARLYTAVIFRDVMIVQVLAGDERAARSAAGSAGAGPAVADQFPPRREEPDGSMPRGRKPSGGRKRQCAVWSHAS